MVHFKDSGTNVGNAQLLTQADERKNQVRSALVKDFNPRKNMTTTNSGGQRSANNGKVILADSGFKTATAFNQQERRFSKKRFFIADDKLESEKRKQLSQSNTEKLRN